MKRRVCMLMDADLHEKVLNIAISQNRNFSNFVECELMKIVGKYEKKRKL